MKRTSDATPPPAFRILLVDDNRNGLLARKAVLVEQGYTVLAVSLPEKALDEFRSSSFDLVITDYRMPGMTGTELISRLRESAPEIPVVLISGMVDVLGLDERNTGADAVVAKNSTEVQHLARAVNRLLHRKPPKKAGATRTRASRARTA
jgi:CheY-like chemotaxis protein